MCSLASSPQFEASLDSSHNLHMQQVLASSSLINSASRGYAPGTSSKQNYLNALRGDGGGSAFRYGSKYQKKDLLAFDSPIATPLAFAVESSSPASVFPGDGFGFVAEPLDLGRPRVLSEGGRRERGTGVEGVKRGEGGNGAMGTETVDRGSRKSKGGDGIDSAGRRRVGGEKDRSVGDRDGSHGLFAGEEFEESHPWSVARPLAIKRRHNRRRGSVSGEGGDDRDGGEGENKDADEMNLSDIDNSFSDMSFDASPVMTAMTMANSAHGVLDEMKI